MKGRAKVRGEKEKVEKCDRAIGNNFDCQGIWSEGEESGLLFLVVPVHE